MTVVLRTRFRNCYREAQNSVGISCCTGPLTLKKWTLPSVISFLHRLADWKVQHQKLDGPSCKFQVWLSVSSTKYSPHCCQYICYSVHDENWVNNHFLVKPVSKLSWGGWGWVWGWGSLLGWWRKNEEVKVKMCGLSPHLVHHDDVITKFVSANLHFTLTFLMQKCKFLRRDFKLWCSSVPRSQSPAERSWAGYIRLWPFLLFSWPFCLRKRCYWKEKLTLDDMGRGGDRKGGKGGSCSLVWPRGGFEWLYCWSFIAWTV